MTFAVRNFVITFEGRDIRKDFLGVAKKKKNVTRVLIRDLHYFIVSLFSLF